MTLRDPYPRARVPEHLTSLSIERLPLDTPFYLSPGEKDDYEPPVVFVDAERQLKVSKSADIDIDHEFPSCPIGLVGVMKTIVIDSVAQTFKEVYVADLRFIGDHQLMDAGEGQIDADDQEDYMHWLALMNDSIVIDGFIAPERGADIDDDAPKGTLYGDEQLHDSLKFLRKKGNKIMKRFMRREATAVNNLSKPDSRGEDKKQETKEATITFSNK